MITPYKIHVSDEQLNKVLTKVKNYPFEDCYMPVDEGWEYGTNLSYLKEICDYWVNSYDWRKFEAKLNSFENYIADVDDLKIHYIIEKGSGENPKPLLLVHGWPGSVTEFMHIIEPLAHPERFGGNIEDAYTVIAPSLPGFAFSSRPKRPMGPRAMAKTLNTLMVDVLGYTKYLAQGGDWGSAICSWIAYEYPTHCKGMHFNFPTMRHYAGPQTEEEKEWDKNLVTEQIMNDGYRTQQATKPQTLSYGMTDSPVGIAAWLLDKFYHWSDVQNNDIETSHSKDDLLTNIMVYVVTNSFNSSTWIYYGRREEGGRYLITEPNKKVEVPTGCALFPAEMMSWPPRSYFERMYNITRWTKMPKGGHFAAMEVPEIWLKEIREFFKTIQL